jgi:Domain of unknown function (DUF6894)
MPRYFFHLEDVRIVLRDDVGEEFGTIEEARGYAVRVAWEVGRNRPEHLRAGMQVLVTDAIGAVIFRTPLRIDPY